ncbi:MULTISPECIES: hypothetical protein [Crateriforma]|uniref:Uncharacterized protein n=1 Tax=Crateriforma conspicua TaxID=2527996 RepID=A0A5C6FRL2_9PLAN|nr:MULTISPECIES: hypothetical protein [Crateriforma]TWU64886.1 hypothetical protein V7x_04300 [Crateriforma conspicua]
MHLLTCPHCEAAIEVSPAQAGGTTPCPSCNAVVDVPKLGQLRQLPRVDDARPVGDAPKSEVNAVGRGLFVVLGLVGLVFLLVAGFCGLRWAVIDVPMTTEMHAQQLRDEFKKLSPAELIRVWEDIEEFGIAATAPTDYRVAEMKKQSMGTYTLASGGVAVACLFGAFLSLSLGRSKSPAASG